MERTILLGNEAFARGAWEAGVRFASAYPGTPSTETLIALKDYPGVRCQWAPNEKVALEVAVGAAWAGARSLAVMKHVGLNVAADALMTAAYTGVNAGLVILVADDPAMHSSQNEQDSRYYARLGHLPMLEPADSQEAKEWMTEAFRLSEAYDTPVLVRSLTRLSHAKGLVSLGDRTEAPDQPYRRDPRKYVMIPAHARLRRVAMQRRELELSAAAEETGLHQTIERGRAVGVIAAGPVAGYVLDTLPEVSVLKLGLTYPLPFERIRQFCASVDQTYVAEELSPLLEAEIRARGIPVQGLPGWDHLGELSPDRVAAALPAYAAPLEPVAIPGSLTAPPRPPVLCAGCSHRPVFHLLGKLGATVTGDIGCYTLGALPPLNAMDTCLCMGAAVSVGAGMVWNLPPEQAQEVVAVIGDSTFLHNGIQPLMDAVYNQARLTVAILDNRTTAMTGGQDHPGTGVRLTGEETFAVDYATLARALGVEHIVEVDPYDLAALEQAFREAKAHPGVSVIVARRPCVLQDRSRIRRSLEVESSACTECHDCLAVGCPALVAEGGPVEIREDLCNGCGVCAQVCPFEAIVPKGQEVER